MFGAQLIKPHESYLGLPSLVGRSKTNSFAQLKERVANKLAGWKEKLLSNAGKEVLIKAVAQAVPSYTMSCFMLPKALCQELTGMVRHFWWGQKKDERRMAWMSWEKMCLPKDQGGLGFKDLEKFNLALLAKQGWRLQTNSSSLFYRVYKAKYFPGCDFIDAKMGKQASYGWRSIMATQNLIKKGVRWQVGDGEKINIWRDKWIPSPYTYMVISPKCDLPCGPRVSALINSATKEWKVDLIKQCFIPQDVEAILSIPLSAHGARDRLIWTDSRNGKFSVRSAYRLAQTTQEGGGQATSSDQSVARKIWRGIWSMKVPNKVKHFTWKACRNILATKENLWRRKVTQEGICEECGDTAESATHLFWFCKQAQAVWSHSKLVLPFTISQSWEFIDVVGQLLKWKDVYPDIMERVIMICWGIWRNRNEVKHGGKRKTGEAVIKCSHYLLEEFQLANEVWSRQEAQTREVVRWIAPKHGQYKVNCDAAVFTRSKEVGFGVIIRDCAGLVIAALSKKGIGLSGAVEAEAKAMEVAVQFAKEVGIREATFEGDSLIVTGAVQGVGDAPSSIQNIVCGITQELQTFRAVEVSHVKRQGNAPAHLLAQHALHVVDYFAWLEECPSFIEHACAHDVFQFSSV